MRNTATEKAKALLEKQGVYPLREAEVVDLCLTVIEEGKVQVTLTVLETRLRICALLEERARLGAQLASVDDSLKKARSTCSHPISEPFSDVHAMGTHCKVCGARWDVAVECCSTPYNCQHTSMRERHEEKA